jgi:hypothetical protein
METDKIIEQVDLPNSGLMYASIYDINRIKQILLPVLTNEKIINFVLKIHQQNLKDLICIEIFSKLLVIESTLLISARSLTCVDEKTISLTTVQICKNLYLRLLTVVLASPETSNEMVNKAFDKIDQIFDESDDNDNKANAVDIMLNYYPFRGERMLNILRGTEHTASAQERRNLWENNEQDQGENLLNMMRTTFQDRIKSKVLIYDDRENVHNSSLNASIVSACRSIINLMITSIIFDGKYKVMVYKEDTIETIKNKLLLILINNGLDETKQIKIYGDNKKEQLQSKMTFEIVEENAMSLNSSRINRFKINRFKIKDKYLYKNVMYHNSFTFPEHINRYGKKGRLLEEAFIATNRWLNFINEESEKELIMYLNLTNIEDADIIWINREEIRQELKQFIDYPDIDNFVANIQMQLFPFDETKLKIFEKIRDGTLMEMELHEILNAVWKFINNIENKSQGVYLQMIQRLKEELEDSENVCCSGVAARLISSIQGFFDTTKYPSLKIKISIDDEMKSKINTLISQKALTLQIDPFYDKNAFQQMIELVIEENVEDIMNEFTSQDIALNGISKENILKLAYNLYDIKDEKS